MKYITHFISIIFFFMEELIEIILTHFMKLSYYFTDFCQLH